jgi:HPt (histidine-containing phosphotransfer) domain-containing protein
VERTAHSLKGNVGIFGARKAFDLAYELETRGREARLDGAKEVVERLENELLKLKRYFSTPGWEQNY